MKTLTIPCALIFSLTSATGCQMLAQQHNSDHHVNGSHVTTDLLYHHAVVNAAQVEPTENSDTLWQITSSNASLIRNEFAQIKVVTWKSNDGFEAFIKPSTATSTNPVYALWVSLAPQTKRFCQKYLADNPSTTDEQLDLRLKQWLGLHDTWNYDVMVELWMNPDDLFRPCVDPQTNDSQCNLSFSDEPPTVPGITDYVAFFNALYTRSFRSSPGVPWTGLGYTFDWAADSNHIGASEFLTVPNSKYSIASVINTRDYCQPD